MGIFDALRGDRGNSMTAEEVAKKLQDEPGLILLDVRSRDEYESPTGHLKGARLIPVEELPSRLSELESLRSSTVVTYCHSGQRSHHAMMFLKKNGFEVINMSGGIIDWLRKGLPVVRE